MIKLREIERGDLPTITAWRNDRELVRLLGNHFFFIGPEVDQRWFDAYLAHRDASVRLAILLDDGLDTLIGCGFLKDIHRVNRHAELAIFIGERSCWSRGLGELAMRQLLDHAFLDLNLNRVHLTVLADNTRAIRLYRRLGFQEEGCLREAVYFDGAYRDLLAMALLRHAFDARRSTDADQTEARIARW